MAVFRIEKTKDYTVMSNNHLKEKEMSLKAKGLLSIMLSLPENWDYSIQGLVSICKENESAINSTLSELKKFGYLQVHKLMPNETESGRIEYVYMVFEKPTYEILQRKDYINISKQGTKKQALENLGVEFQGVENQVQYNTNNQITNKLNTNNIKENIKEILSYLNAKENTSYRETTPKNIQLISARLKEKFTLDDFKKVIDKKYSDWRNTEFIKYLRPETLFGTKFESYLNEIKPRATGNEATKIEYTNAEYESLFDNINEVEI